LSVAFTKEDSAETASETLLPDRPASPHPNLVTVAGLEALEFQLHQAREAYETAQKIEDVNERRRQAATSLRDVRRNAGQVCVSPTRELLSEMLGVRRTFVTEMAAKIQASGAITNSRGIIKNHRPRSAQSDVLRML
jgi:CRP-like cAMP-binding protein